MSKESDEKKIDRYMHMANDTIGIMPNGEWVLYEDHIAALEFADKQQAERDARIIAAIEYHQADIPANAYNRIVRIIKGTERN